jgi:hypothetical protein
MSDPVFDPHRLAVLEAKDAARRLGRIVGGYTLAVTGGGVARTLAVFLVEAAMRGPGAVIRDNGWASLLVVALLTSAVVFLAAAPFATAFLVQAESRRLRGAGLHVGAGAVIGPATQSLVWYLTGGGVLPPFGLTLIAAAAGALGGWLYWIVAVRSAPPPPMVARPPVGEA